MTRKTRRTATTYRVTVTPRGGEWGWEQRNNANGSIVAVSPRSFKERSNAIRSARAQAHKALASAEVVE